MDLRRELEEMRQHTDQIEQEMADMEARHRRIVNEVIEMEIDAVRVLQDHHFLRHSDYLRDRVCLLESLAEGDISDPDKLKLGGDVKGDLEAIRFFAGSGRFERLCLGFKVLYGLPLTTYHEQLQDAPNPVINTLNIRADYMYTPLWASVLLVSERFWVRERIISLCDRIVYMWVQCLQMSEAFPNYPAQRALIELDFRVQLSKAALVLIL